MPTITSSSILRAESHLRRVLSRNLFNHCVRVGETAKKLAKDFDVDPDKAKLSGLLHDCAKELSDIAMIEEASANKIVIYGPDRIAPNELHSRVGELIAKSELDIFDTEILEGVRCHTFGEPNMSDLAKVVLIADDTEPERDREKVEQILSSLKKEGLNSAVLTALELKVKKTIKRKEPIHPLLHNTWNQIIIRNNDFKA